MRKGGSEIENVEITIKLQLPNEKNVLPFLARGEETFDDLVGRICEEQHLELPEKALVLIADGVKPGSVDNKYAPGGLLDGREMVSKRRDILAQSRVKLVLRDSVTAVYSSTGGKPRVVRPAKVVSRATENADAPEIVPSPTEVKRTIEAPTKPAPQPVKKSAAGAEPKQQVKAEGAKQQTRESEVVEFMPVTVRFPASYPMDVQTVDLPLHYVVEDAIKYMLDVALVSDEKVLFES
jgi:hypothetical protein